MTLSSGARLGAYEILARFPIWLANGRVMYRSSAGLRLQGTGGPEDGVQVIPGTTDLDYPAVLAPDGDSLVFLRSTEATSFNVLMLTLRDPAKTKSLLQTRACRYRPMEGPRPSGIKAGTRSSIASTKR